ncbi:MAG: hypothetical protein GXY65_06900 [Rhodococcus sp.]|uniref:hypothetical protein n=1 Tax=Rhodococcus TaxID=1827 RepID=UPI001695FC7A|nr:hypothetical protein [Rhodococcus sp. (in: high G+C Gram-positive bacteria)]NLV79064.1 hypothetical protein [Rhodococcus sp. (in: high G+C Gram-positive bacteria)]
MTKSARTLRILSAAALGGAAAFAGSGLASAEPIDIQPTTLACGSGIGEVFSQTTAENPVVEDGQIFYYIMDKGATGAQLAYVNLATGQVGVSPFALAPADTPWIGDLPVNLVQTTPGTVVSAVFGLVQNTEGETCVVLPGIDVTDLPAAPVEGD